MDKRRRKAREMSRRKRKARDARSQQEERLDVALLGTFPASDPIAAGVPTGTEPLSLPVDREAPLIDREEVGAVARRRRKSPSER